MRQTVPKMLFCMTVFLAFLVVSASLPQAQAFSGSGGEFGNWSWDGTNKILTIVANATANAGDTEAHAYNFQDIVNAIDYYGWYALYNRSNSGTQFEFSFRIVIGDGSTTTWFVDTLKEVHFKDGVLTGNQEFIKADGKAHLRLGEVVDVTKKVTRDGVALYGSESTYTYAYLIRGYSDSEILIYNSFLSALSNSLYIVSGTDADYPMIIWNTRMVNIRNYGGYGGAVEYYKNQLFVDTAAVYSLYNVAGSFDNVEITSDGGAIPLTYYADTSKNLTNLYIRNVYKLISMDTQDNPIYFKDTDSDNWIIKWYGTNTAEIYRQYSFDLKATYPNGTAIQNVNVTISNKVQGKIGSWLTFANGSIPKQILTQGFYNQTGGDTIYSYNPYNITATFGDYTYYKSWTVQEQAKWEIALLLTTTNNLPSGFMLGAIIMIPISIILAITLKKRH